MYTTTETGSPFSQEMVQAQIKEKIKKNVRVKIVSFGK